MSCVSLSIILSCCKFWIYLIPIDVNTKFTTEQLYLHRNSQHDNLQAIGKKILKDNFVSYTYLQIIISSVYQCASYRWLHIQPYLSVTCTLNQM